MHESTRMGRYLMGKIWRSLFEIRNSNKFAKTDDFHQNFRVVLCVARCWVWAEGMWVGVAQPVSEPRIRPVLFLLKTPAQACGRN